MMTSLEQLLRDAMDEHTSTARPIGTDMAHAALRGSRRTHRLQTAAIGGTSVAAAVVAATATLGGGAGSTAGSPGAAAPATSGVAVPTSAAVPPNVAGATFAATRVPNNPRADAGPLPAALDAVTLPDPAPGFPLRLHADGSELTGASSGGGVYWTKFFRLGVTPERMSADSLSGTPTGPEANVLVHDAAKRVDGTIVGHTTVDGQPAVLVDHESFHGLGFSAGKFSVEVWGTSTVTQDQLVALAESLRGLPG